MLRAIINYSCDMQIIQNWILAVYDDAALHGVIGQGLCIAAAVNQAIDTTIDELVGRHAPPELVTALHQRMLCERKSMIYSLGHDLEVEGHTALQRCAQARLVDASSALAAHQVEKPRPRALTLVK
uniref:Acriflavin resistance protein n=2 Tax=Aureimonas frigidaquae TaxID=424757 RepID=A0A0P0Z1E4_9HYPH|nr:acriflavin resistance protein [Aureimonas frigidaquae]